MRTAPAPVSAYRPSWVADVRGLRLAVVGAEGFIGSQLVRLAAAAGAVVTAVCVRPAWRLAGLEGIELVRVDAWWQDDLRAALADADAVVLLAYEPPLPGVDPLEHERRVNRDGSVRLAESCRCAVFASSADVYGPWRDELTHEADALAPSTSYAVAKAEAEARLPSAAVLRIATVFGPGELGPRAVPSFVCALVAGIQPTLRGDDVRDLVHVVDVAGALLNAAAIARPATLNVGSGCGRATSEVLAAVQGVLGTSVEPLREESRRPPSRLVLDITAARGLLGFAPREDFAAALDEEVRWIAEVVGRQPSMR